MTLAEEWMYTNAFLVDLEESFGRWRLIESALPVRHGLSSYATES